MPFLSVEPHDVNRFLEWQFFNFQTEKLSFPYRVEKGYLERIVKVSFS